MGVAPKPMWDGWDGNLHAVLTNVQSIFGANKFVIEIKTTLALLLITIFFQFLPRRFQILHTLTSN